MQQPTREELAKIVHVTADVTARWDSVEYDLSKGVDIAYGVVEHWKGMYPNATFAIEEISETPIIPREILSPLGDTSHQEAFAGLKRRKKTSEA